MNPPGGQPLLSIRGLSKSYAVPVLQGIDFDLHAGQVHALVGANGAGKSTLSKIICGLTPPDQAQMTLDGQPYAPQKKHEAQALGIHMILQELNLIPTLSIAENLFLDALPSRMGMVNYPSLHAQARQVLALVGLEGLDPAMSVASLGVGQQQMIEIAGALWRRCRLLILDEPTAALTDREIGVLFGHIERLKAQGVGMIYISHRMEEIRRIAGQVTVLRDGRVVASQKASELTIDDMVRLMSGREPEEMQSEQERQSGPVILKVDGLRRGPLVRDVSFEVHRGEILGLAGLVGAGRTETLRAVFGADLPEGGRVMLGEPLREVRIRQPRDAVRAGLGMIPEDRKQDGLLLAQSSRVNISLAHLKAMSSRLFCIDSRAEAQHADEIGRQLEVRWNGHGQLAGELSGGNQQKVLVGRWLVRDCDVLLFDEPTRGIDVAAKWTMYRLLRELAGQGKALVVASGDMSELMGLCDRIAVMSNGRLCKTFRRGEWTQEAMMHWAFSEHIKPGCN